MVRLVPWWGWALVAWSVLAVFAAGWLAKAARIARSRERATRAHQYDEATQRECREAS